MAAENFHGLYATVRNLKPVMADLVYLLDDNTTELTKGPEIGASKLSRADRRSASVWQESHRGISMWSSSISTAASRSDRDRCAGIDQSRPLQRERRR